MRLHCGVPEQKRFGEEKRHKFSFLGDVRRSNRELQMGWRENGNSEGQVTAADIFRSKHKNLTITGYGNSSSHYSHREDFDTLPLGTGRGLCAPTMLSFSRIAAGCRMKPNTKSFMLKNCSSRIKTARPEKLRMSND